MKLALAWFVALGLVHQTAWSQDEGLPELLDSYSQEVITHAPAGFSTGEAADWVARLDAAVEASDDPHYRQSGLVAIMSLWCWTGGFDRALETCDRAYGIAADDTVRFQRLLNRFGIIERMGSGEGRGADPGGDPRLLTTFKRVESLARDIIGRAGALRADSSSELFRAGKMAARQVTRFGDSRAAASIRRTVLEIVGDPEIFAHAGVHPMRFRYLRSRAAATALGEGKPGAALRMSSAGAAVPMTGYDVRGPYLLATESGAPLASKDLHEFIADGLSRVPVSRDSLAVAAEHAQRLLRTVASDRPADGAATPVTSVDGVELAEVVALLESELAEFDSLVMMPRIGEYNEETTSLRQTARFAKQTLFGLLTAMGDHKTASMFRQP